MPPAKAAVAAHTDSIETCPVLSPRLARELAACRQSARELAKGVGEFLQGYSDPAKANWLNGAVEASQFVFQPWTMQLLFVLAVMGDTRFSEMQRLLGISSRTLSDKLQVLREAGLVDRQVFDEQPVRIEYRLTRDGKAVAALATPLFAQINARAAGVAKP